ncbi:MAG: LytR C-terminal domain-containing protein [Kineosporiaceae bacterium]|nr:LytR C-terminal domain-containing protein [Kineosporiaceae bacterium]
MTMTRSDHDERFEVIDVSRRGAHRARPNPLTGLLPLIALVVVVVGVVWGAIVLFGQDGSSTSTQALPSVNASAGAVASPQASAAASPQPAASPSAQSGESSGAAPVDKTITLNFYNGTSPSIPGHSRKAAAALEAQGWKIGTILPWDGAAVSRTTVYYGDAAQLSTARAVVKVLGVGTVKLNTTKAAQGLAVVVSNDYTS